MHEEIKLRMIKMRKSGKRDEFATIYPFNAYWQVSGSKSNENKK